MREKEGAGMDKSIIAEHLYNDSIAQAVEYVKSITDEETLCMYAYNYNWDNGFDVPQAILQNENCSISIALLIFYAADGVLYLEDKSSAEGTRRWITFVRNLYKRILQGEFHRGATAFKPQLSRVQEYKLKKVLTSKELVFITPIGGVDCGEEL